KSSCSSCSSWLYLGSAYADAVAARRFGLIESFIGPLDQIFCFYAGGREFAHANTDCDIMEATQRLEVVHLDCGPDPIGHRYSAIERCFRQEDNKLLASESRSH